jgi:hypothetical protein
VEKEVKEAVALKLGNPGAKVILPNQLTQEVAAKRCKICKGLEIFFQSFLLLNPFLWTDTAYLKI